MTFDRRDWLARQSKEPATPRASGLQQLAQAAVPAATLMADQHWAIYQQMLQAVVNRTIANRDRLLAQLMSDACNSYEDMVRTKRLIAECEATIRAWVTAIELPKQLLDSAEAAREKLDTEAARYDAASDET